MLVRSGFNYFSLEILNGKMENFYLFKSENFFKIIWKNSIYK